MTEYKEIDYRGAKVGVATNGEICVNGKKVYVFHNKDGYACCSLKTKDGWRLARVARLVAIAFILNPENLPEVNHKDYNRANDNVENLEWMSHADNVRYSNCNRPDYTGERNPNYGNRKLSKIYVENKELAKEKQGRPGLKNGRCRKISIFKDGNLIKSFDYMVPCIQYIIENYSAGASIEGVRSQINKSIRENTTYKGLTFVKE